MKDKKEKRERKKQKEKSRGKGWFFGIALIILLGVFVFSAYKLYTGFQQYWENYLASLETRATAGREDKTVDWEKLKKENREVFGWIYCENSKIDYAVVQGKDNSKYLTVGANGKAAVSGALFADCNNKNPLKEPNTIIYGHHMKNGSMFHDLDYWQKESYRENHPYFYFYTPEGNYKLTVVAAENVSCKNSKIYGVPFQNESETKAFLDEIEKKNKVKTDGIDFDENDCYVTLSTCAYDFEGARSIVVCKVEPIKKEIEDIEKNKAEPDSKWKVFCDMVVNIIKEGI